MSDKNTRIDNLPPTTAGLSQALTILRGATGCPDCEAERLLSQWDGLNTRYGGAVIALDVLPMLEAEAKERQGSREDIVAKIPQCDRGKSRDKAAEIVQTSPRYVSDAKRLRDEAPPLPIRTGDQVYQAALSL